MMDLQPGLDVSQRAHMVLTQRMRQSLRILQTAGMELTELVREAVLDNPFLEEEAPELPGGSGRALASGDEDAAAPPAVASTPWQQRLIEQVRLQPGGAGLEREIEYLVGCLDGRGYLGVSVIAIARALRVPRARIERARQVLLEADPPGLGARNLRECLLAQLRAAGDGQGLAARIIRLSLRDLAARRHGRLASRLDVSEAEVRVAADRIRLLVPAPRALIDAGDCPPIYPDLRIEEVDGRLEVFGNERIFPSFRFRPPPASLLEACGREGRAFIHDRIVRARWLLGSLDARRRTLLRLGRLIVEEQRGFFEQGVENLKPMGYRHLAVRIGLHESTVARAVRDKYVQTPRGLFPLRFFFAKGLRGPGGEEKVPVFACSRIRELVRLEDRSRPLTDREMTQRLRRDGVCVSRRTVAKYRDKMRIPRSALRRRPAQGTAGSASGAERRDPWTSSRPPATST